MRKAIVALCLGLMAVGLLLAAFGTQQTPVSSHESTFTAQTGAIKCSPNECSGPIIIGPFVILPRSTEPNFILNYLGASLAVLGVGVFAFAYLLKRSDALRSYPIPASL